MPRWRRSRVRGAGQGWGRPSAGRPLWGLGLTGPCGGGEEEVVPCGQQGLTVVHASLRSRPREAQVLFWLPRFWQASRCARLSGFAVF